VTEGHSIQVKRRHSDQAFSDAGEPCGSVAFPFDLIDAHLQAEQEQLLEQGRAGELSIAPEDLDAMLSDAAFKGARKALAIVTAAADARAVGLNAFVLAHVLATTNKPTQRSLARQCKLSPGRVSQLIKALKHEMVVLNAALRPRQGRHARNEGQGPSC
jgi:hypothetical protein